MKPKDIVMLCVAVVILLGCGYVAYTQLLPHKSTGASAGVQVEVIGVIPNQLDQTGISMLNDRTKVMDYNTPISMTGLNNNQPFGP